MKKTIRFRFFQIVAEKGVARGLPMLDMEESEINILWAVCRQGPKSIYDLKEKTKFQLQLSWPKRVWIQLPDNLTASEAREMAKDLQKPKSYQRSSIRNVVNELSVKNLVETIKDTSGARIKTIVKPTFQGLVLYLQNPFEKGKLQNILKHYSEMIPFSDKWGSIANGLGEQKRDKALEQTLNDFVDIQRVKFLVRPLKMEFEGFLEDSKIMFKNAEEENYVLVKDKDVAEYLVSQNAAKLREAHIAYLITKDIQRLSGESKDKVERLLKSLESEKELAYFEKRPVGSCSIFRGKRLREFLPKYSSLEFFFTGMFVKNLLWKRIAVKEKPKNETYDFEVEFY